MTVPAASTLIGRYAVHGEIASGGMASVHFARLLGPAGFARTVAVKMPHKHLAKDPEFALMFIDEARLAARIRHPNVVSTLDVIRTDDELVLVMDYVHGEALSKLSAAAKKKGERIPVPVAASILIDALHGLHAAHEATDDRGRPLGIVHRDVSPQNILVGLDGITRIVDFGIAKAAGQAHTTKDGAIKGKYAYMAPEQLRGEKVSALTDVFAASIVLWELLTGERLFLGRNEAETMHKCLVSRIRPPSMFAPDLPPKLDEILRRGLARDPAQRYASAREMALDIEACVAAIRPSEIGAWVERTAGDSLAARAEVLANIERSTTRDLDATPAATSSEPLPGAPPTAASSQGEVATEKTEPSLTGGLSVSWARGMGAPSSQRVPVTQHAETSQPALASVPLPVTTRSRRRTAWAAVAFGGLVAIGGAVLFAHRPAPTETTRNAASAAPSAPVDSAPHVAPAASIADPEPAPAASAHAVVTASPRSTAAPPNAPRGRDPGGAAPRPASRPAPSPAPRGGAACDPPYTIDAKGRQIFKLECM